MRSRGFTLLEIVLAIGLAGAVLALLTTAIDLYLVRVDRSRSQVESAQLARTLLNQIAADLCTARYYSPSTSTSSANAEEGGGGSSSSETDSDPTQVMGIFGTATELRIDRSAEWRWDYLARQADLANAEELASPVPLPDSMPQTVRYVLGDGKELLAAKLAAAGVDEESVGSGYAGLFRQQKPTASWLYENAGSELAVGSNNIDEAELIAPEVVDIEFMYFDGEQLVTEWDSSQMQGLPTAVEIRLTMLKEPFEQAAKRAAIDREELRRSEENLVEYRLVVQIPEISEPQEAEFPQPLSQQSQTSQQNQQEQQPGS